MALFFTADEHYGHANILKFCHRPFSDLDDMREQLIFRHNAVVSPDDLVWHLGDMFWRTLGVYGAIDILSRLNGKHSYIKGNHEEVFGDAPTPFGYYSTILPKHFAGTYERTHIHPEGGPKNGIVLDHYAGRVWHDSDKGSWQLYGHTHAALPEIDPLLALDVGVDANDYTPVSLADIAKRMTQKIERVRRGLGLPAKG